MRYIVPLRSCLLSGLVGPLAKGHRAPGSPGRRRGMALGSVLMLVGAATMVAFTTVALVSFQMSLGLRQTQAHAAHNAAESALAVAIARIGDTNGTFGRGGSGEVRVPAPDGTLGVVTFAETATEVVGGRAVPLVRSTHNFEPLQTTAGKPGHGRTVPKDSIHLVGNGITQGGVVSRVEAIIHFPPFTYAIATTGPLTLFNSTVGGVRDVASLPRDGRGSPVVAPDQLDAGDVGSNGAQVLQKCRVKGDARSGSTVSLSETQVDGETRQGASPLTLPTLDLERYDPYGQTVARELDATFDEGYVSGNLARYGDLTVVGDLQLDDGLLYVEGNLTVQGGIKGRGMVVVRGDARVAGASHVEARDSAALLVDGSIVLSGDGIFQGMVYCKGAFQADHVTIVGCLVQNSPSSQPVQLDSVRVLSASCASEVGFFRTGAFMIDPTVTEMHSRAVATLAKSDDLDYSSIYEQDDPAGEQERPTIDAVVWAAAPPTAPELTYYCHRHQLITVTRRGGKTVYTMLRRIRNQGISEEPGSHSGGESSSRSTGTLASRGSRFGDRLLPAPAAAAWDKDVLGGIDIFQQVHGCGGGKGASYSLRWSSAPKGTEWITASRQRFLQSSKSSYRYHKNGHGGGGSGHGGGGSGAGTGPGGVLDGSGDGTGAPIGGESGSGSEDLASEDSSGQAGAIDGDLIPPLRDLIPNTHSPWEGFSTTTAPGVFLSIQESYDLDDLLQKLEPHQRWINDHYQASIDVAGWRAEMRKQINEALNPDSTAATSQGINFSVSPSRFLTPYDRMKVLYWGDV